MNTPTPLTPALDIYEQNDKVYIIAEMPGVNQDNVSVHVHGTTLTIGGIMALATADGEQQGHEELKTPYYNRNLQLGDDLDGENIAANFKDGLLTLTLGKKAQFKPRKIDVKFS